MNKSYGVSTKILEIVAHYEKEHARECIPKYLRNLQNKYKQIGESVTQKAHEIAQVVEGESYNVYGKLVHSLITKFAENDPDKQFLGRVVNRREGVKALNEVKLRSLYNKYLIEPCSKFVSMNDDEWLVAYEFDDEWVELDDISYDEDKLLSRFSGRYKVCKRLIGKDQEKLYQLFKEQANRR